MVFHDVHENAAYEEFHRFHSNCHTKGITRWFKRINEPYSTRAIITETGIGKAIELECPHCKTTKNITNYASW